MSINCIGILTSGGDAPGMNAAIRAVTRSAIFNGIRVKGIYRGYKGLVTGEIQEFRTQNVSNIIQMGGTILKTARCMEFKTPEGRKQAYENMQKEGIDALVVIGGAHGCPHFCHRIQYSYRRSSRNYRQRPLWNRYDYRLRHSLEHNYGMCRQNP